MIIHHFPALLIFSLLVSVVFGVIGRDANLERFWYGLKSFVLFVGIAVALGWLMYFFPPR